MKFRIWKFGQLNTRCAGSTSATPRLHVTVEAYAFLHSITPDHAKNSACLRQKPPIELSSQRMLHLASNKCGDPEAALPVRSESTWIIKELSGANSPYCATSMIGSSLLSDSK